MKSYIATAALLVYCVWTAAAYPNGAPESACNSFRPNHVSRTTGQLNTAQNEVSRTQGFDDLVCPITVNYSRRFTPGQPITLTISTVNASDYFRGYMLSIVEEDDDSNNLISKGSFASSSKVICGGDAVTQNNSDRKTSEQIVWTAPKDGSKKTYSVWVTVVRSFSHFWVDCGPVELPAFDAEENIISDTIDVDRVPVFNLLTEDINSAVSQSEFDKDHNEDGKPRDDVDDNASEDQTFAGYSSEDESGDSDENSLDLSDNRSGSSINSVGADDSGDSDENSIDVSDNRSGSSLESAEKKKRREKYLDKGIQKFDEDIESFLKSVGKGEIYAQYKQSSGAISASFSALFLLVAIAIALF